MSKLASVYTARVTKRATKKTQPMIKIKIKVTIKKKYHGLIAQTHISMGSVPLKIRNFLSLTQGSKWLKRTDC